MTRNEKGQFVNCREDVTGQKFNHLTALNFSHKDKNRKTYWDFQCDCGAIKTLRLDQVKSGNTKSCGCWKKITDEKNMNRKGSVAKYADLGPIKDCNLYSRWLGIKNRCYNVHFKQYKDYGGRGIKVCDEWLYNFKAFYDWSIENGYSQELQIDRINNDGNYEPNNCRWVTRKVNMNNTRRNRKYANTEVNNQIAKGQLSPQSVESE